ncbi:NAD(P)H-binding protein [Novosphingobium sp. PASSN1]|uniref:NAD(P)H-binding protein n=1 Tax=Novosphingobium sp. PASSN1 TaxID=2015561 RepID=UPI000BD9C7B2|nr:NAD(P)H-binding protein [Novosphingobium sp. PASSN1]OYU35376.1 MAG: epimerase [Novosphingobium sp. PASSN1]
MSRVALIGATGTIGRAAADALVQAGHDVTCIVRSPATFPGALTHIADSASIAREGFGELRFDAVVSCMASRTGVASDAWAIDHKAQSHALAAARKAGAEHFVLLSAICVQRPRLAFQQAKLAFESELAASGLRYSIVRPTAFFKSLSGQLGRVRQGKPFLIFGDGTLTACKPISNRDLAAYIAACLTDPKRWNTVLPIGGPGPAISPRDQGEALFAMLGMEPRFRSVPPGFLGGIAGALGVAAKLIPPLAAKAELARIGHYYATESMLVLDPATGRYDADLTPETGTDTLFEHYRAIIAGKAAADARGDHAVF